MLAVGLDLFGDGSPSLPSELLKGSKPLWRAAKVNWNGESLNLIHLGLRHRISEHLYRITEDKLDAAHAASTSEAHQVVLLGVGGFIKNGVIEPHCRIHHHDDWKCIVFVD